MIETILIAVIAARLRGYKIKPILSSWHIYPTIFMVALYCVLNFGIFFRNYNFVQYSGLIEFIYMCTFFILIFKYKQYTSAIIGCVCVVIGTVLNKIAIYANGGKMPVFPTLSYITGYINSESFGRINDIHILGNYAVKLKILTDFIDLGYSVLSIGDVFIRMFTFLIIYNCIKSFGKVDIGIRNNMVKNDV